MKSTTPLSPTTASSTNLPRWMITLVWDVLLASTFTMYLAVVLVDHSFNSYVMPLVESYRRQPRVNDFHPDFDNEFTYYNRHCSKHDITTTSSSDLLIKPKMSGEEAADVMLRHGAVAFQNILDNNTVAELRDYLASRHTIRDQLSWNEVMWNGEGGTRLSLGIGTEDHPIIQKTIEKIGQSEILKRTLEGILGEDPAIVEISTLTSLSGAHDQGIHSDTDWYGSSLNYARSFLHSYSFFVALQDTPQELGATTVCPGTHYCADQDLESVCLKNGAFSVSTNGYTGEHGLLRKGDAFLFNQNVWHRGPKVQDVDNQHLDRIMFIMTFVSRNKATPGDRRRQALGTFYYQRWNMWGATFNYLKDAGKVMVQPLSGLRALGLYNPPGRNIGIYWIENFCHQLATGEYFYDMYELYEFKTRVLDKMGIPTFLQSSAEEWEDFITETLRIWIFFLSNLYLVILVGSIVWMASTPTVNVLQVIPSRHSRRVFWFHIFLAASYYMAQYHVANTGLAKSVKSGDVFVRPFPAPPADMTTNTFGPNTFPERSDVLVATRYDAKYLASYDHFLDNHPGNEEWQAMVKHAAHLPYQLQQEAAEVIVSTILNKRRFGRLESRFLWQDPATGAWRIMSERDAVEETQRAIIAAAHPDIGRTWKSLKYMLAEARFGPDRNTYMARNVVPFFVDGILSALFNKDRVASSHDDVCHPDQREDNTIPPTWKDEFLSKLLSGTADDIQKNGDTETQASALKVGQMVWGIHQNEWYEAILTEEYHGVSWAVDFLFDKRTILPSAYIRKYLQVKEGERVTVDYYGNGSEFYHGTITYVKPSGLCCVMLDDGEFIESASRWNLSPIQAYTPIKM